MNSGAKPDIDGADRVAVILILIVGAFGGGLIAGLGLIRAIFRLMDPSAHAITLLADIPLDTGAGVEQAHGDRVVVTANELSTGALWTLALADVIAAGTVAAVTVSFAVVLWRIAQRRPFHRSARIAAVVAGASIAVGGVLAQGVGGLGTLMAADELDASLDGVAALGFEFDPVAPLIGLGILALAYVFQAGERLQRDTEGLV